jgi:protein associated with RNAse G/E
MTMRPAITVRALRADGSCYRSWTAQPVYHDARGLVTFAGPGGVVDYRGTPWVQQYAIRAVYWFDRPYNLLEVFASDGTIVELYVHIASPARLVGDVLEYTDHELDVVLAPGGAPRVIDEDEFAEAAARYGYTADFQQACYAVCREAEQLLVRWPTGAAAALVLDVAADVA